MKCSTIRAFTLCIIAGLTAASAAAAEPYPQKPIKVVVPYPPGGPYDSIARVISQKVGEKLGQPFIVENRAGANGAIGANAVAKSAPDGYTLLMGGIGPNAINESLYPNLPYNAAKDFAPIIHAISSPNVLVVNSSVKARTVNELRALERGQEGKMAYASAGAGSSTHLFAVLFGQVTKMDLLQVPYKGDAPAVTATISGETPMYFASAASILPHIVSGRLRALAVTGEQRLPALPQVPTMNEAGVKGYQATAWYGFFAPKETPVEIIGKLNQAINEALKDSEVRQKLSRDGAVDVVGGTSAEFGALVRTEAVNWKKVIDSGRITVD